jgi:hypothetical protein
MVGTVGNVGGAWEHAILPRIRDHLPTQTILEIAPGFGRWTHYLKDYCRELWIVDRIGECIEACRQRFASDSHVHCYLNDGRSLPMIPDASVDFVFSFDSLVYTKRDVVEAYLRELGTKIENRRKRIHSPFQFRRIRQLLPRADPAGTGKSANQSEDF